MAQERRAHRRAPGALEGTWSGSLNRCRITSLSLSGCFIDTMSPPRAGGIVRVELHSPDEGPITVKGEVVASDHVGMGFAVRFVDLAPETREKLARIVDRLSRAQDPL
jgi:hypothetical protein